MTAEELEALPETGGFTFTSECDADGFIHRKPVYAGYVLYHKPDDPLMIEGGDGTWWSVGWHDGRRYKRRLW